MQSKFFGPLLQVSSLIWRAPLQRRVFNCFLLRKSPDDSETNIWKNRLTSSFDRITRTAFQVGVLSFHSLQYAFLGLPGGACASTRVPTEERWDREQEVKGPTGGAAEPQPGREKGAGGHSPGTPGAAVSDADRKWTRFRWNSASSAVFFCFFIVSHLIRLSGQAWFRVTPTTWPRICRSLWSTSGRRWRLTTTNRTSSSSEGLTACP